MMERLIIRFVIFLSVSRFCASIAATQQTKNLKPTNDLLQATSEPAIFGEGVISTGDFDSHPAFMPDGKTLYFVRSNPGFTFWTILVSHFKNGKWNEPQNISAPVNSEGAEWYPTVTRDGTLYFGSDSPGGKGRTDIYRSRLVSGKYAEAENLGDAINMQFNEFEPYISPDEKFLIFMCGGRADSRGGFDLYISYNRDGAWTKPVNLGDKINSAGNEYSPAISPDGKYFFWTSTRTPADKPLEKPMSYRELMNKLRSPRN